MKKEAETLAIQIEKLKESEPVISTGLEYDELYELSNRAAEKYIRDNLRGNYLNTDTGDVIRITRKGHVATNENTVNFRNAGYFLHLFI